MLQAESRQQFDRGQCDTQITVQEIVSSRYPDHQRPASWDYRIEGIDTVRAESGELIKLRSTGGQSPPKKGWKLVLTGGNATEGHTWTLYGLPS